MVSDDLVKRLRATRRSGPPSWIDIPINPNGKEAEDRIEALQAQLAERDKACAEWAEVSQRNYQRATAAEAQLAKAREDALREAALKASFLANTDANMAAAWRAGCSDTHDAILALLTTPTPAPSPDDLVKAAREDIARAIFVSSVQSHMSPKDWDSGMVIGPENSYRKKIYKIADAVIAAIIERAGK
jgi:hypothetical protein